MRVDKNYDAWAEHSALRARHSPTEFNTVGLRNGTRWTLLQAIAWIATEVPSFVDLVGSWTPIGNVLPSFGDARGASLELAKQLNRLSNVLSFPAAQIKLFQLLRSGSILIYVDHVECIPAGIQFTGLTYNHDLMGLSPAPDDRFWGYVVIDAESLRQAWSETKPVPAYTAALKINSATEEMHSSDAPPPLTKRRGRPVKYDWVGADTALTELDGTDDTFARVIAGEITQASLEQYMADWFAKRNADPGESSIRERVSKLLAHRRETNAAKANK